LRYGPYSMTWPYMQKKKWISGRFEHGVCGGQSNDSTSNRGTMGYILV